MARTGRRDRSRTSPTRRVGAMGGRAQELQGQWAFRNFRRFLPAVRSLRVEVVARRGNAFLLLGLQVVLVSVVFILNRWV